MPNKIVMIIDDDTHTNAMLADTLKLEGFETVGMGSGEEALDFLKDKKVDMILLDLLLPGIKGWKVVETLRNDQKTSEIPVIVLSILSPEDTGLVKQFGNIVGYVCKPFDMDHLMAEVKKSLA